jgi:hypothetical protein
MRKVERGELLGLAEYEQIREQFRKRIIEDKRARRVALGPNMTLLFENHDTAMFQIQEMLRTERITAEAAIEHELATYNELVPGDRELSASAFIEYGDREERDRMLVELAGVEESFYLSVGGERFAATTAAHGERSDRTTAVHYLKFPMSEAAANVIRERTAPVGVGVSHKAYSAEIALEPATLASLAEDLR